MFRSALLILSGNTATSLMLLARNLLVARLISVEDYGIAATFAIAMAVVEMASQLGLQQQIIQAKEGEQERFQAALQGFQLLRGVAGGLVLFFCAGPIANFLNVPETKWAYQVMALVPVLMALTHFDIHRLNRSMQFWPVILSAAVPALVSLLAVFPLAVFYGDYRVMLWAIVIRAAMIALTSQIVAKRRFQLVLDRAIMAQSLHFGWPLLVNGALMFAVFQGDKLIVGRELGMATLAIFAMGFTLTLTPTLVMAKSAQNFFLPQLSAIDRDTPEGAARFQNLAMVAMQVSLLNAALLVVIFVLVGAPVVSFLLGAKYAPLLPLLAPLAVMQGLRVAKAGGAMVALSCGHTRNAMQANLMRIATLPLVWMAVVQGAGLLTVIAIASCGEIAGYLLSLYLVRRKPGVSLRQMIWPVVLVALLMAAAIGLPLLSALPAWVAWGVPTVLMLFVLLSMKALRDYVLRRGRKTKTSQ